MDKSTEQALAAALGRRIAKKRQEAALTQEQVAEKLDLQREAIARVERGTAVPTVVRLVELAELFGCTTTDLLEESSTLAMDQANEIAQMLKNVSLADRQMLVSLLQTLTQRLRK